MRTLLTKLHNDRRGYAGFGPLALFMIGAMPLALMLFLAAVTSEIATFQRITTEQVAITISHDAADLVSGYDNTATTLTRTIPPTVTAQIHTVAQQAITSAQGTGSATCYLTNVSTVSCTVTYRTAQIYMSFAGLLGDFIGTTQVTRTSSLVGIGLG